MTANHETPRSIPTDMDPALVAAVDARLDGIEREHGVRLGFAIESGSRAWGFPSPDSDYDCRFVYVRPEADYRALYAKRDVIETPLTATLDVNGWDLAKAVKLLVKGNAVIVEWLTSPIVYRAEPEFRRHFLDLVATVGDRDRFAQHYAHLARRQLGLLINSDGQVVLKKVFYTLRPALALRWLRQYPQARYAPMHFPTLCKETALPADVTVEIERLLALKATTRELGSGPMPPLLLALILAELEQAEQLPRSSPEALAPARAVAEAFFAESLAHFAPG